MYDVAPFGPRESEFTISLVERQSVMLQAELMQDGSVQIAEMDFTFNGPGTCGIGFSIGQSAFDAAAGHPESKAAGVVAGLIFFGFGDKAGATKFTPPDHQCFFEQTPLFQVFQQGGNGSIR